MLLVLRSNRSFLHSRASPALAGTGLPLIAVTVALPFGPVATPLGLAGCHLGCWRPSPRSHSSTPPPTGPPHTSSRPTRPARGSGCQPFIQEPTAWGFEARRRAADHRRSGVVVASTGFTTLMVVAAATSARRISSLRLGRSVLVPIAVGSLPICALVVTSGAVPLTQVAVVPIARILVASS
ncbi:hypothetical protein [Micromonospora sp. NPDC051141]|uniref:hypothetical protein n=1 Tax=Micromonospora sp. NPDC051141 TaxID=3364284 RepID=UPI003797D6C2